MEKNWKTYIKALFKSTMTELSIIIVSFNTAKLTIEAIESLVDVCSVELKSGKYEIIVSDNDSKDNTVEDLKNLKEKSKIKYLTIIENKKNLGFAKGNNVGIKKANGKYLLFLNSDTVVRKDTIQTIVGFLDTHKDAGAATCKIEIPLGGIDEGSHRGFPTPWNAFCHFSKLEKLFPKSRLFAGYTQGWKDFSSIHAVDAIVGAFMMVRKEAGDQIGWWDEDYFFYGEDLDFCFMLHRNGWKIYYVPVVSILHYGGVSSGIKKQSQNITTSNLERKIMVQNARFAAMKIFYKKHYENIYPKFVTWLVFKGIDFLHKKNTPKINS